MRRRAADTQRFLEGTRKVDRAGLPGPERVTLDTFRARRYSYIGELKIWELRARAEQTLGAKFDRRRFHEAVLANGSVPLPVREEQIDAFIVSNR